MTREWFRNMFEIFKRELRSYFESPIAYVFMFFFLLLVGFFTFARFLGNFFEIEQADLRPFFIWHPWVYLLLVPAVSMRLWAEERRAGTIELLLTLPVTMTQTVVAKFLAGWLFLSLALALTFPAVLTTLYLGDPDMGVIFCGYLGSMLLAGTYLSAGLLTSAMTRNQVISFVLSLVVCMFLLLAGWPPVTEFARRVPKVTWLVDVVAGISVMPHYEAIQRGVINLRDIVYFLSVIVVMLFTSHLVLQSRKAA